MSGNTENNNLRWDILFQSKPFLLDADDLAFIQKNPECLVPLSEPRLGLLEKIHESSLVIRNASSKKELQASCGIFLVLLDMLWRFDWGLQTRFLLKAYEKGKEAVVHFSLDNDRALPSLTSCTLGLQLIARFYSDQNT